jgi:signal transduction histidine kinase
MFKVSARTILALGSELISSDVIAFYELIKNGFDARSPSGVEIHFRILLRRNHLLDLRRQARDAPNEIDALRQAALTYLCSDAPEAELTEARSLLAAAASLEDLLTAISAIDALNTILIADTGSGMSMQDLSDHFLVLGTPHRKRQVDDALARGDKASPFLGEKGIGRLSVMRLGNRVRIETARRDDVTLNVLEIDWSAFSSVDALLEDIPVAPTAGGAKPAATWSGTNILVSDLHEDWTEHRVQEMGKLDFSRLTDPFLDQKDRPRIVLSWNGKRLAIPWLPDLLLEHAHARLAGEYTITEEGPRLHLVLEALDLGYEHPKEREETTVAVPDLEGAIVGTSGLVPDSALRSVGPFSFEAHWFNRRRLVKIDGIGKLMEVRDRLKQWSGILLFRDGFRILPYGDDEDDWLGLDRKALGRSSYLLNKAQFIGRVQISRTKNPHLEDQTNREGLRENPEQQVLLQVMHHVIQDRFFGFLKLVETQYKRQKPELSPLESESKALETRARTALKQLRSLAPKDSQEVLDELQQTLLQFADLTERARLRADEVEVESRQMIEMAGVGLMVEVVAHELARASEHALENLQALRGLTMPEEVRAHLDTLRAQMKSLSKRVRVLDSLSVSGRQHEEVFALDDLVRDTLTAHDGQFRRHGIRLVVEYPPKPIRVRAVKGMAVQILENLLSNSKYWLRIRGNREKGFTPTIRVTVSGNPPSIVYQDNGLGIDPENSDRVFRAFFSLKEKSKRRGLGLFIARECAEFGGGSLTLDDHVDPDTGRLHRFTFELPEGRLVR